MIDVVQIAILFAVASLSLLAPAFFIGRRIARGELRIRFSLRALLALVTIAAVSCGILRLPLALPIKLVLLWWFSMLAAGLMAALLPAFPGAKNNRRD